LAFSEAAHKSMVHNRVSVTREYAMLQSPLAYETVVSNT
jgi:hypothetical protein